MVEIKALITEHFVTILGFLFGGGSFYGYILEKKKRGIEEKQLGANALQTMQDAYDKFTADSLKAYTDLNLEVQGLKSKQITLTLQLIEEQNKYVLLKIAYDRLKVSNDNLSKNFAAYKKQKG